MRLNKTYRRISSNFSAKLDTGMNINYLLQMCTLQLSLICQFWHSADTFNPRKEFFKIITRVL